MPTKPKKPCSFPGCPRLTHDRYCEEHTKVMNARYNKYERPYDSSERYGHKWRRIRNRYIETHPLCEECLKTERYTPAQEVHHILPLEKGGTHNEDNLMALCKSCHSRITAESGDRWHKK
jgi:5-methylcytosine-specific restriction protein A